MKIIHTYKQRYITWFNLKHLFELEGRLLAHKNYSESELLSWIDNPYLKVNIRKPYDNTTD